MRSTRHIVVVVAMVGVGLVGGCARSAGVALAKPATPPPSPAPTLRSRPAPPTPPPAARLGRAPQPLPPLPPLPPPVLCPGLAPEPVDLIVNARPVRVAGPREATRTGRPAVVLVLAGYNQSRFALDTQARLTARLVPAGAVVAVLQGSGATPSWALASGASASSTSADIAFVTATVDRLVAACGDPGRVVLVGFSDGGLMAALAGCALGPRLHALVLVSSSIGPGPGCSRPHTLLAVHGTDDPYDPYRGNGREIPPARSAIADWAHLYGCATARQSPAGPGVELLFYPPCPVSLLSLSGAGHTWPGGGPPADPNAGAVATGYDLTAAVLGLSR